ncbi:MAG: phenylalanine--tRNA ligase subunit alpha [Endomicrobium sp.]|jgi:phenylalanyl-tRNA synthetase alpha chain|nr:phenylalanine--tRNA ligase subunit alpha [Endomicrobium sp.]
MKNDIIEIEQIISEAYTKIENSQNITLLNKISSEYLGKKSKLSKIIRALVKYPIDQRKEIALTANQAKNHIKNVIISKRQEILLNNVNNKYNTKQIDCSTTSLYFPFSRGSFHPIISTMEDIITIFKLLGFSIFEGNDIENDWYNFEALNIPQYHPARDIQDTFYIDEMKTKLLRTHTSAAQIHVMEEQSPPIQIIVPGRVYRNETQNTSHSSTFHQIEGLVVNKYVTFVDLKTIIKYFVHKFFERDLKIRFRPSYFQFTEPSAEVDIQCYFCDNTKCCSVCSNSGWIEILGCGMVHPNVFKSVNYDTYKYKGYAFGIGIERIAMIKYQIDDIRLFYANDLAFLQQF